LRQRADRATGEGYRRDGVQSIAAGLDLVTRLASGYHHAVATDRPESMSTRLKQALDLFEAGVSMKRAALRREHVGADADEIERLLRKWLATRPGARYGDGVGRRRPLEPRG